MPTPSIIFILPLHNEERVVRASCESLAVFLSQTYSQQTATIILADNGSTDATAEIVDALAKENPGRVRAFHTNIAGRGNALRTVLAENDAEIFCYMDADLPIPLEEIPSLLRPVENAEAEIAIGKRAGDRPLKRRLLTRVFSLINVALFNIRVSDAQCGAKAFSRRAVRGLIPLAHENGFFLDTEILCLAKQQGLAVQEVPIHWIEQRYAQRKSSVRLWRDTCRAFAALARISTRIYPRIAFALSGFVIIGFATLASWRLDARLLSQQDFVATHQRAAFVPLINISIFLHAALAIIAAVWIAKMKRLPWHIILIVTIAFWLAMNIIAINIHPTRAQDVTWNLLLVSGWTERILNPYTTTPVMLADHSYASAVLTWKNLSMTHGPLWTILLSLFTRWSLPLGALLISVKAMLIAVVAATGFIFWKTAGWIGWDQERRVKTFALLAWSPLLIQMTAVDAHNDALVMLALAASFALLIKKRPWWSAFVLLLGGFIKYVPWLLLPIPIWEILASPSPMRVRIRQILLLAAVFIVLAFILYAPFGYSWQMLIPLGKEFTERIALFFMLPGTFLLHASTGWDAPTIRTLGLAAFITLIAWFASRRKPLAGFTIPFLMLWFFFTPWFQPWYALWILPVIAFSFSFAALARWTFFLFLMAEPLFPLPISIVYIVCEASLLCYKRLFKRSIFSQQTNTPSATDSRSM